jgi:hypothetical protein
MSSPARGTTENGDIQQAAATIHTKTATLSRSILPARTFVSRLIWSPKTDQTSISACQRRSQQVSSWSVSNAEYLGIQAATFGDFTGRRKPAVGGRFFPCGEAWPGVWTARLTKQQLNSVVPN